MTGTDYMGFSMDGEAKPAVTVKAQIQTVPCPPHLTSCQFTYHSFDVDLLLVVCLLRLAVSISSF